MEKTYNKYDNQLVIMNKQNMITRAKNARGFNSWAELIPHTR